MKTQSIVGGMTLLLKYYADSDGYHASTHNEELHMSPTDRPLTLDDLAKMIELGWHQEHDERDFDESFSAEDYRPGEEWISYI